MAGNLIIPRIRVTWGEYNLTAYNGPGPFPQGSPIVYDTEVQLQSQTQAPTGSMKWDPTGAAFDVYERFISDEKLMGTRIFVDVLYFGGKRLRLAFVWAGQTINYGNDMSITISLKTELDGLINSNIRNVTQAYDEKKGATFVAAADRLTEQYRIPNKNIIRYTDTALKDLQKAKLITNYGQDQTYGAAVANLVQQNGNVVFANNIEEPSLAVYTPFSWDKDADVLDGSSAIGVDQSPAPNKRYGYIVGPGIIDSMSRKSEWQPPQQTNQNTPSTQVKPTAPLQGPVPRATPSSVKRQEETSKPSSSPQGPALARPNPGIQNKENPDGPTKQKILNQEGSSSMDFQTFLCPLLVGIKPHDIVYVPSYNGEFIEDWIVDTVNYDQSDGNVSVSVSAKRQLGLGTAMNEKNAKKFLDIARSKNLVGPNATLEAWEKYAWSLPGS